MLVIAGGSSEYRPTDSVEVFDLSGVLVGCEISDIPYPLEDHKMATLNGAPVMCGGEIGLAAR